LETACKANPDQWFPVLPRGGDPKKRNIKVTQKTKEAIELCNACPVKDRCLELGMERDNLEWGIWGGKTAGERMAMAGMQPSIEDCRLMGLLGITVVVSTQKKYTDNAHRERNEKGLFVKQ